jgi:hypothetical protein
MGKRTRSNSGTAPHADAYVTYDEDRSNLRTGTAPQVAATFRNTAISLHRIDGALNIAEACRTTAFSPNRGLHLLTNTQNPWSKAG